MLGLTCANEPIIGYVENVIHILEIRRHFIRQQGWLHPPSPRRLRHFQTVLVRPRLKANFAAHQALETRDRIGGDRLRSEEHTSELPSLMRNSYAVFLLQKKTTTIYSRDNNSHTKTDTNV